ncbi:MAG: polysaccharide pyruvyl transferase family protein [Dorea sp.]|nr:polysaccharide pyruvyl transferase family protein [Dorea sp.]
MSNKNNVLWLRRFHGYLHEKRLQWENKIQLIKYLYFPIGRKIYIIGTPLHNNIGDSAIVLAEKQFLKKLGFNEKQIKEITMKEFKEYETLLLRSIKRNKVMCCWLGGGNMGDQWMAEEQFRRRIIEKIPQKNPMIIFPQTIFYSDTKNGKQEEKKSIFYYNNRKNLTIVARERSSYEIMKTIYPETEVMLVPDIVLSTTKEMFGEMPLQRKGILLCLRSDKEKKMSDEQRDEIMKIIRHLDVSCQKSDMYTHCELTKENRAEHVYEKMSEFAQAELVITDRLHGMIFSAITETPCIVFSNYNHKVRGTYEWIKYLPYIKYVEDIEEMKQYIPELLTMKNCKFDNTSLLKSYENLAEKIKEKSNQLV